MFSPAKYRGKLKQDLPSYRRSVELLLQVLGASLGVAIVFFAVAFIAGLSLISDGAPNIAALIAIALAFLVLGGSLGSLIGKFIAKLILTAGDSPH